MKILQNITFLYLLVSCLLFSGRVFGQDAVSNFGVWSQDENGLPAFVLNFHEEQCQWYPFSHTMGTGYNMVLTNQWGDVHVITTESGLKNLTPALWYTRGGFFPMIEIDNQLTSLLYTELDSAKSITYGVGYTTFSGISTKSGYELKVDYTIITPFNFEKGFHARLEVQNVSGLDITATITANSDVWIRPGVDNVKVFSTELNKKKKLHGKGIAGFVDPYAGFDNIALIGNSSYAGSNTHQRMTLRRNINLSTGEKIDDLFQFAYNTDAAVAKQNINTTSGQDLKATWLEEVEKANFHFDRAWINRESVWDYSQLLSFSFYDKSLEEYFISLGGYGIGDLNTPNSTFGMREIAETAMVLAYFNPKLSKSSLRWMAKTQSVGGDLLRLHDHKALQQIPTGQRYQDDFPNESDTEIWFLMAVGEYVNTTGDLAFLSEQVDFLNEDKSGTVWEHAKVAFDFIKTKIGTGDQGLIRMLHGDWNDYFSKIGEQGNGQSVMNTGMMCKALLSGIEVAKKLEDPIASEMQEYLGQLQEAVSNTFDQGWFIRAYDDNHHPVGGYDDRLFLNAQSWAVLGKCGTEAQRQLALKNAIKHNSTSIGLTLISEPYSSPTPENISWAPIPAGEGENAGIWPQTVGWMIWALAEEGMTDLAMQEWEKSTLHSHTQNFPEIPFGIINGPDCYSSVHAGNREGWTQIAIFDRMIPIPMLPIIAWQSFGLKKILENK